MANRNFTATVKERVEGQPCYVMFELDEDIGVPDLLILDLPDGTNIEHAKALAKVLNASGARLERFRTT